MPHRNVWGEKNRRKKGEFWWNWERIIKKRIQRYGVNLLYVGTSLCLLKSIYYEITIDMKILLQPVSVAATGKIWIKIKQAIRAYSVCSSQERDPSRNTNLWRSHFKIFWWEGSWCLTVKTLGIVCPSVLSYFLNFRRLTAVTGIFEKVTCF